MIDACGETSLKWMPWKYAYSCSETDWIVSVDDFEDITREHEWLGSICILGGI